MHSLGLSPYCPVVRKCRIWDFSTYTGRGSAFLLLSLRWHFRAFLLIGASDSCLRVLCARQRDNRSEKISLRFMILKSTGRGYIPAPAY